MAQALGVFDRPVDVIARECETIHHALRGVVDEGLFFWLPPQYRPPPLWLASDDPAKWAAVGHLFDGWLTFLTTPRDFLGRLADVATMMTAPPAVGVRLDVRLVRESDAPPGQPEPVRGVVTGSRRQLERLAEQWRDLPVDHLIVGIRGSQATQTVQAVREAWRLPDRDRTAVTAG